nr:MAG TPA: hypothetical protein [Caudoviricetes sp.]
MSFTLTQNLKSFRTIPYLNLVEPLSAAPVAVTYNVIYPHAKFEVVSYHPIP